MGHLLKKRHESVLQVSGVCIRTDMSFDHSLKLFIGVVCCRVFYQGFFFPLSFLYCKTLIHIFDQASFDWLILCP